MYHELTIADRARKRRNRIITIVIVCVVAVGAVCAYLGITSSMREQAAASIREAILNSARQCAAIEGSYPASIEHLEKYYGLRVNEDDYVITYDVFASNIMPTVLVLPR